MNLDALAAAQHRVVHRHQLLRAGISASTISRRLHAEEWRRLLPAVYSLSPLEPGLRQRLVAALLYAGADAQIAGRTALRVHGLRRVAPDDRVHLLVPHHRQVSSVDFVVLHRTCREVAPARFGRLPTCPLTRAVADTARWGARPLELRSIVAEAVTRRLTTVDALRGELAGSVRNRTAALRKAIDELGDGECPGAGALRASLLLSRVLPLILWNPRLRAVDGRPLPGLEGWIPDAALGVEVDGYPADPSPDEWERAAARRDLLAGYGALVLQFPPSRLRYDPIGVRRTVERAYLQRKGVGPRVPIRVA